jgi:transcriptional regulator with XRE-family HTH domain
MSSNDYTIFLMEEKSASTIFAQNVVRYRKKKGLSQYDLADLTGLSRRMISHYEREGILPPMEKLEILAKSLNVKISQLFEEESEHTDSSIDLSGIDPRSVKKLKDILSLAPEDRNDLYRVLNKLVRKNQLEKERLDQAPVNPVQQAQ